MTKKSIAGIAGLMLAATCAADVANVASRAFPKDYVKRPDPVAHSPNRRPSTLVSSIAVAPNGRLWATWYCGVTPAEDQNNYVVLATSDDDGKTWKEVLVEDPDDFWPRRTEQPRLAMDDGRLVWSWTDRVSNNKDGAEQTWRVILDADNEPPPGKSFAPEFVKVGN